MISIPHYENTNPSSFERKVAFLLNQGEIPFVTEFSFLDLKSDKGVPLRFDFALFDNYEDLEQERPRCLVEAQGPQHYERRFKTAAEFARQQANDKRKRAYCRAKNISLLEIPYTEYNSLTLDFILEGADYFN